VNTIKDTQTMVASMAPIARDHVWIYCHTNDPEIIATAASKAFAVIREGDDSTLILERDLAAALGFDLSMPMRQITLQVFSALDGFGLTAAFAPPLARAHIPCNVVAAFHHDHLFVPEDRITEVMEILRRVQAGAPA
jgi:hypothetical protein